MAHEPACAQEETGRFQVFNFSPKAYNSVGQNWAIAQDNRGMIYAANNQGVLEYDGVNWRTISTGGLIVLALERDPSGRIYAGLEYDFGYLEPVDSIGEMAFVSLLPEMEQQPEDHFRISNVHCLDGRVYFQSGNAVFVYAGGRVTELASPQPLRESFLVGNSLFCQQEGVGLCRVGEDGFSPIEGTAPLKDDEVFGIEPMGKNRYLVACQQGSLYTLTLREDGKAQVAPFATEIDRYLEDYTIYNLLTVRPGVYSIGTWGGGLVLINGEGKLLDVIDADDELQDLIIQNQFADKQGNVWLALSNGISRITLNSPLSLFDGKNGLPGTVQAVTRAYGRLYAASNRGLFYLQRQPVPSKGMQYYQEPAFNRVEELEIECWGVLTFENKGEEVLLVITNNDITEVHRDHTTRRVAEEIAYSFRQSATDPSRVYIGLGEGLMSVYRTGKIWKEEARYPGIEGTVESLCETRDGTLWISVSAQDQDRILRLDHSQNAYNPENPAEMEFYDTTTGLPGGPFKLEIYRDQLICTSEKGVFIYDKLINGFTPFSSLNNVVQEDPFYVHRLQVKDSNHIWLSVINDGKVLSYESGFVETASAPFQWNSKPFRIASQGIVHALYIEDQTGWMGGDDGLFRFNATRQKEYDQPFQTYLRSVTTDGEILFNGAGTSQEEPYTTMPLYEKPLPLSHAQNNLVFTFGAEPGTDESFMQYSFLLEGQDREWTEFSHQTQKEFTNLWEGTYHFRVKAVNIYGETGEEAVFSFHINPPWYRTVPAYIAYILLLVLLVYTIVVLYTRNLRAIIRERTHEIRRQKEMIELKNREITDSIQYASKIQSAVLPPGDYVNKILPVRFIMYLPRDIVSGDFYWITESRGRTITVAADCTGHGVPGAFMSMLGIAYLNEIVSKKPDIRAHEMLNELRSYVINSLHQTGKEGESKDGMDIAICILDLPNMTCEYAGANNPLYLIRDNELITYKADRMPIGIHERANQPFTLNTIQLQKNDLLYTFSDGYVDQFGGPKKKKFMSKRFKRMLLEIHKEDMLTQHYIIETSFYEWMGEEEQVDDVIVLGVRI